jgi:hypothetical protein
MNGLPNYGDQNGSIYYLSENYAAWNQLYWAGLIKGDFGAANITTPGSFYFPTVQGSSPDMRKYLPPSKLKGSIFWNVSQATMDGGQNYYTLSGVTQILLLPPVILTENKNTSLTPTEAFQLDSKLDDGMPRTGKILAKAATSVSVAWDTYTTTAAWSTATASSAASGDCITGGTSASDTANIYATSTTAAANTPACLLRLNF